MPEDSAVQGGDDQVFAELCRIFDAVPAGSPLERLGIRVEVDQAPEVGPATLAEVRELLGDCRRCKLCDGRKQVVFGGGLAERPVLMVVGEGPGHDEDVRGEPFVGPAGQMLDKMLQNVLGLPRASAYVTNVVMCRPPGNRDPEPDEVASCLPFLQMKRDLVRPSLVLLLGAVALRAALGLEGGIRHHRGRWHSWGGIPTVATFHPSYLLRKPEEKPKALEDLRMLADRLTHIVSNAKDEGSEVRR